MKIAFAAIALLALMTAVDASHRHYHRHHSCSHFWWADHDLRPCKNHAKVHR
jgi:hypothetical protein